MYAMSHAVRSTGVQVAIGRWAIVAVAALLHWLFAWEWRDEGAILSCQDHDLRVADFESDVATYKATAAVSSSALGFAT